MTMKTTHTHRGTCQACGAVQAVANGDKSLAKHGYTVDFGYFNGTCQGSDRKPAELDVAYTGTVIVFCVEKATEHEAQATLLRNGKYVPETFERWNPRKPKVTRDRWGTERKSMGDYDTLPIAQATTEERRARIASCIHMEEMKASGLRSHAKMLTDHVLPRLGQPLFAVEELNKPKAKPAAPVVDVKAGKVEGTFTTKAARKEALDRLNRQYEKLRRVLQDAYLAGDRVRGTALYYAASDLHQWRPHHSAAARELYPALESTVAEIEALVKAREAVKAAP